MIAIRQATAADLEVLVAGNLAMAMETETLQLDTATVRAGVAALLTGRAPGSYWVATDGTEVRGQLMITFEWSDWRNAPVWWVQSVYVDPASRGQGIYRALYRHVRQAAQQAGAAGIRLYVDTGNTRAQEVYAALGMNGGHYRVFEDMFAEPPRATA